MADPLWGETKRPTSQQITVWLLAAAVAVLAVLYVTKDTTEAPAPAPADRVVVVERPAPQTTTTSPYCTQWDEPPPFSRDNVYRETYSVLHGGTCLERISD